jgi:hypothetical protein
MARSPEDAAAARRARLPDPASVMEEASFSSPKGKTYRVIKTSELDPYERPLAPAELATAAIAATARLSPGDNFGGTDRHDAKLTIVTAQTEQFNDLEALVASLPADADMVDHDPEITQDPGSERVAEEQRNVRVRAFLYAASRETDNDFHFIVGRDPNASPTYMNMELSGLPPRTSASFARLDAARTAYKTFVHGQTPGAGYHHYDPPIPIEVEGSLFFDITHAHGPHPGPAKLRPKTIWEVHPISNIVFEP